jgi:hypothetical protein
MPSTGDPISRDALLAVALSSLHFSCSSLRGRAGDGLVNADRSKRVDGGPAEARSRSLGI